MRIVFGLVVATLLFGGCHHHEIGAGGDGGGMDGGGDTADMPVAVDLASPDLAKSCPSNILCGDTGACCDVGQECVDGACLAACASDVRCTSGCCDTGQVCLSDSCVAPTTSCQDTTDCAEGEFCEPTLGACLPQPTGGEVCEYHPPVAPYTPKISWQWTASTIQPDFGQVINTPAVADLDGDGTPDVVIVTSRNFDSQGQTDSDFTDSDPAYLRVLDGKTGLEKWGDTVDAYLDANQVNPRGTPAIADIDKDGKPDIVVPKRGGGLFAFNGDGSRKWTATNTDGTAYTTSANSVTVSIADMDHDGFGESVIGGVVFDHTGKMISGAGREHSGENRVSASYGAVSIIADVDGDGIEDVVTGRHAWKLDGTAIWDCTVKVNSSFCGQASAPVDGYAAIADFEQDGTPELVVIASGNLRVQNAVTGAVLTSLALPGTGSGGPPTIDDFNGDGRMDIASANGDHYNVFTYDSTKTPSLVSLWSAPTQDGSSNVTGSSVFDFEGDGKAEVVYNDECYLRVYKGADGTVLFQTPSSSATIHEYPILVDVDGDNHTELVVVSNDRNHLHSGLSCPYQAGEAPRHGVFVYRDVQNRWVRTRRLWNEHAYHVSNINNDATLPEPELASWLPPTGLNNYRVSTQGATAFNAPDLAVDLEISTASCPTLQLRARVKNEGSLGVAAGVTVDFYEGTDATGTHIGSATTTMALLPGASEVVTLPYSGNATSFYVVVDGGATSASMVPECNESNNSGTASNIMCPVIF